MHLEPHLKRIFRVSAWYDIIVTAGFATPWIFAFMTGLIADAAERLGLPGTMLSPDTSIFSLQIFSGRLCWYGRWRG